MILAAGVMLRAPSGRVLVMKRTNTGLWAFPGGHIDDGEEANAAAARECFEETGRKIETPIAPLMRRVKDGVDFTTFVADVPEEFVPEMNDEHSEFAWIEPKAA